MVILSNKMVNLDLELCLFFSFFLSKSCVIAEVCVGGKRGTLVVSQISALPAALQWHGELCPSGHSWAGDIPTDLLLLFLH